MIASADIGVEVAKLLTEGWNGKKIVELGSPISPDDLAAAISEVIGKPVTARAVPRDHWTTALEHMGFEKGSTAMNMVFRGSRRTRCAASPS